MSNVHILKNKWTRRAVAGLGGTFAVVMLCVSAVLNYRYGYTLGTSEVEKICIGLAAVSADGFMAVSPFFGFAAIKNKERVKAICAFTLWFCMTGICAWSAVSQISFNRQESAGSRAVVSLNFDDLRKAIDDARSELKFIPEHRPEATVRSDINAHKVGRLWTLTNECDEGSISGRSQREYCSTYQKLQGELGNALAAAKARAKLAALNDKSERAIESKGAQVVGEADAGATTVASLLGISVRTAQSLGAMLFASMLLLGTSMGLYVSWGTLREPDPEEAPAAPPPLPADPLAGLLNPPEPPNLPADADPAGLLPPPPPAQEKAPAPEKPPIDVNPGRPEPKPEARAMLDLIDYPKGPLRGPQRPKGSREHVGWRFYAWLYAHDIKGAYPWEAVDGLYAEFCRADHREPWALRVAKVELEKVRWVSRTDTPVVWTFAHPKNIEQLIDALKKRGVIGPEAETVAEPAPEPPAPGWRPKPWHKSALPPDKPETEPADGSWN